MEISQTSAATGAAPVPTETVRPQISSDFETFLKMLTVQMENQDPLNPIESSDYAVQLATFSGVEQQVLTNDLLKGLAGQLGASGMAQMAAWVGKEARAPVPGHFDGQPITVAAVPADGADRTELVVYDSSDAVVQRFDIPVSSEPFDWAGATEDGFPLPADVYRFEVVSYASDQVLSTDPAEIYSRVSEVRTQGDETILVLASGATIASSKVTALRDPSFP